MTYCNFTIFRFSSIFGIFGGQWFYRKLKRHLSAKDALSDHDSIHGHRNLNDTECRVIARYRNFNAPKTCKITVKHTAAILIFRPCWQWSTEESNQSERTTHTQKAALFLPDPLIRQQRQSKTVSTVNWQTKTVWAHSGWMSSRVFSSLALYIISFLFPPSFCHVERLLLMFWTEKHSRSAPHLPGQLGKIF